MSHYTAVTRNREHGKGEGVAVLLRHDLAYTEIDDIQLTSTTDNEQLTVAIRIDSNRELYVSTVYCLHANPSVELIDGLCENRDQIILTGDFNSKHPELGNDQTKLSGTRLVTATQNNNLTLINDGTPTFLTRLGKEDVNDLIFISQSIIPNFRDFWVGDDHGSDHFIINGVFSYTPIYNKMNEKTVRLSILYFTNAITINKSLIFLIFIAKPLSYRSMSLSRRFTLFTLFTKAFFYSPFIYFSTKSACIVTIL